MSTLNCARSRDTLHNQLKPSMHFVAKGHELENESKQNIYKLLLVNGGVVNEQNKGRRSHTKGRNKREAS